MVAHIAEHMLLHGRRQADEFSRILSLIGAGARLLHMLHMHVVLGSRRLQPDQGSNAQ